MFKLRYSKFVKFPSTAGKLPLNRFSLSIRYVKYVKFPKLAGIIPYNLLAANSRYINSVSWFKVSGRIPTRLWPGKSNSTTWNVELSGVRLQITPCQLSMHGLAFSVKFHGTPPCW